VLRLEWKELARDDLNQIIEHIADDNPDAAATLADDIEAKAARLPEHPELYRAGRKKGTREMVVHPNYIVIYRVQETVVEILRVKHAAQQWPKGLR
jgi:addiction module RelE/StbE family toxin